MINLSTGQMINNIILIALLCLWGFIFLFKPSIIIALTKPEEKVRRAKGTKAAHLILGIGLLAAGLFLLVSTIFFSGQKNFPAGAANLIRRAVEAPLQKTPSSPQKTIPVPAQRRN